MAKENRNSGAFDKFESFLPDNFEEILKKIRGNSKERLRRLGITEGSIKGLKLRILGQDFMLYQKLIKSFFVKGDIEANFPKQAEVLLAIN